ncbi:MAG: RsmE family RNA methyltransferase [Patescibacteria group bacterium]
MRLHRFFIKTNLDGLERSSANSILRVEDGELALQWHKVMRFKPGSDVILLDGKGNEASARITTLGNDFADVEILSVRHNRNEPMRRVVLYCSVLKRENFELVAQKATEVGVSEIVPIIAERTEKLNLRIDRLEKIVKEAAEQSGRGMLPAIHPPAELRRAFDAAKANDANFFFDPSGRLFPEQSRVRRGEVEGPSTSSGNKKRIGIFIGPEGGWTPEEISLAKTERFELVSLGKLILRAETAAITATYLAVNK